MYEANPRQSLCIFHGGPKRAGMISGEEASTLGRQLQALYFECCIVSVFPRGLIILCCHHSFVFCLLLHCNKNGRRSRRPEG